LNRHSEPSRGKYQIRLVSVRQALFQGGQRRGSPLVLYLLAMQAAVQISGPYFAPYMLSHLKFSYVTYMVLVGIGYFGKVIALPLWGRVAKRAGTPRLLWIGGASIVPMASLWLGADLMPKWDATGATQLAALPFVSDWSLEIAYLAGVQLLSGIMWAAYELAMLLMLLEAIPRAERPCVMTYYNFGNAAAQVVGGLIGALILQIGQESHAAYLAIFAGSSLVRLATVPLLLKTTSAAEKQQVAGATIQRIAA
jgi:MFS family permease